MLDNLAAKFGDQRTMQRGSMSGKPGAWIAIQILDGREHVRGKHSRLDEAFKAISHWYTNDIYGCWRELVADVWELCVDDLNGYASAGWRIIWQPRDTTGVTE